MSEIFHFQHIVRGDEIDLLGHANNVAYIDWLQHAAMAHSTSLGWSNERYIKSGRGWVARSHFIEYHSPAFEDDEITVRTWVATMAKVTSERRYRVFRPADGLLLAAACTRWAYVDLESMRPLRIPADLAGAFPLVGREMNDPDV